MNYLTLDQILRLHALVLSRDGGGDGARDIGRLEAAVATQYQSVFETELYPTIFAKAAAVMRGIIADHPFVDSNKRTAILSGLVLLEINHIRCAAKTGEVENFAVRIAVEHLGVAENAEWLEKHSEKK